MGTGTENFDPTGNERVKRANSVADYAFLDNQLAKGQLRLEVRNNKNTPYLPCPEFQSPSISIEFPHRGPLERSHQEVPPSLHLRTNSSHFSQTNYPQEVRYRSLKLKELLLQLYEWDVYKHSWRDL